MPKAAKDRICKGGCGVRLYGPGARCPRCQAIERQNKRADRLTFPKPKRIKPSERSPDHLAWIRSLSCIIPGCREPAEAAHVRLGTGGGMGLKPPDKYTVPACHRHHMEQHSIGHQAFDAKYGVDMKAEAERLARLSPHLKENAGDEPDEVLLDPRLV